MMDPKARLTARTRAVAALDAADRHAMWRLYRAYYVDTTRAVFDRDLDEKDHVILLFDADGVLQGFSTLKVLEGRALGRRFVAVFSGDTIVDRAYWGQTALQRAFLSYVIRTKLAHPATPVWWFLISKGYRTYLLLSRNFPEHWPRHDRPTPAWPAAVLDHLARARYPEAWRPADGILRFPEGHGRLREAVAPIDRTMLEAPDIRFFVARNPGHSRGDELCCLGRVDLGLWVAYMAKLGRRAVAGPRARPTRVAPTV